MGVVRVLFLADTHLGFDLSFRPRVQRCRQGPDFFANFKHALQPAFDGAVDCVIHGGDILYRSKVPPQLVEMAFEPLIQVADMNIPVYIVPGNHECSAIPHADRVRHPNIHIFDRPRTFILQIDGTKVALTGFAFVRQGVRRRFLNLLGQSGCCASTRVSMAQPWGRPIICFAIPMMLCAQPTHRPTLPPCCQATFTVFKSSPKTCTEILWRHRSFTPVPLNERHLPNRMKKRAI